MASLVYSVCFWWLGWNIFFTWQTGSVSELAQAFKTVELQVPFDVWQFLINDVDLLWSQCNKTPSSRCSKRVKGIFGFGSWETFEQPLFLPLFMKWLPNRERTRAGSWQSRGLTFLGIRPAAIILLKFWAFCARLSFRKVRSTTPEINRPMSAVRDGICDVPPPHLVMKNVNRPVGNLRTSHSSNDRAACEWQSWW